ncbi:hypothetical protein ABZ069_33455 [Streptomyces microflavus]|uniref:hypothetical protein n=1 Tax=Streptomyces microflavus TaxID=1919 RepID=UPI0033A2073B
MDVRHLVTGLPRPGGRRGGGRQERESERVGQAVGGEGPDREVLRGPGGAYESGHYLG